MRAPLMVLCVALIAAGCSKKKNRAEPQKQKTETAEPSDVERAREAKRRAHETADQQRESLQRRRVPMTVTADEVASHMPLIDGATQLRPPEVGAQGREVVTELCLAAADPTAAATAVETSLAAAGWTDVNKRASRKASGFGMSGQKSPYRITASVVSSDLPACAGADGKIHATLRFHKLLTKDEARAQ